MAGEGAAVGVVAPPAEVGPGDDPGPALWSLVYMSTAIVTLSKLELVSVGDGEVDMVLLRQVGKRRTRYCRGLT